MVCEKQDPQFIADQMSRFLKILAILVILAILKILVKI
jgi:hypothetical protein